MGQKIFDLINDTYKDLYGYSELSQKQIDQLIKSYLSFLDFNLITCIEDWTGGEHKLIGVGITMRHWLMPFRSVTVAASSHSAGIMC